MSDQVETYDDVVPECPYCGEEHHLTFVLMSEPQDIDGPDGTKTFTHRSACPETNEDIYARGPES